MMDSNEVRQRNRVRRAQEGLWVCCNYLACNISWPLITNEEDTWVPPCELQTCMKKE